MSKIKVKKIRLPLTESVIKSLKAGDMVEISGSLYTARDAAHRRFIEQLKSKDKLPVNLKGETIFYVGPTPAPAEKVSGSAGPTTASRLDVYTPLLIKQGLKGMIGKGSRSPEVIAACQKYQAIYLATFGGCGALLAKTIHHSQVVAFADLGPEAVRQFSIKDFPAVVAIDMYGKDLFSQEQEKYKKILQQ